MEYSHELRQLHAFRFLVLSCVRLSRCAPDIESGFSIPQRTLKTIQIREAFTWTFIQSRWLPVSRAYRTFRTCVPRSVVTETSHDAQLPSQSTDYAP